MYNSNPGKKYLKHCNSPVNYYSKHLFLSNEEGKLDLRKIKKKEHNNLTDLRDYVIT